MSHQEALDLLGRARAPRLHLLQPGKPPVTVCPSRVGAAFVFAWPYDSAPAGQAMAVASEHVTCVPDALGGGTLYLEASVEGPLVQLAPQALPEALALPVRPGVSGGRASPARVQGTTAFAQDFEPAARGRLLEALWVRGLPEDPQVVEQVRAASPETPTPPFLSAPDGCRLICAMGPHDGPETVRLLEQTWVVGIAPRSWEDAHRHSSAWVGARDDVGGLIATARAVSDWVRNAWIYDVVVAPEWRRRKLGTALMWVLLEHPSMREVSRITLRATEQARASTCASASRAASRSRTRRSRWCACAE